MKKWLIAFILLFVFSILYIYVFIPDELNINRVARLKANQQGIFRTLRNDGKWVLWWPGQFPQDVKGFSLGKTNLSLRTLDFRVEKTIVNGFEILIQERSSAHNSLLTILPLSNDSTQLEWKLSLATTRNPINRVNDYRKAKQIARNMDTILSAMKRFMEERKNIYEMNVELTKVTDTFLISINTQFAHQPTLLEIYGLFGKLENYAKQYDAKLTNPPMLHIERTAPDNYKTIVAIPVNRILPEGDGVVFKRMVPGNIVVGEVQGGIHTIQNGFAQLDYFLQDYQKSPVAIQFESLVTDRSKEPDTSKWVTRLYYPVY